MAEQFEGVTLLLVADGEGGVPGDGDLLTEVPELNPQLRHLKCCPSIKKSPFLL